MSKELLSEKKYYAKLSMLQGKLIRQLLKSPNSGQIKYLKKNLKRFEENYIPGISIIESDSNTELLLLHLSVEEIHRSIPCGKIKRHEAPFTINNFTTQLLIDLMHMIKNKELIFKD